MAAFCDLAAKYDIYVIVNAANAWVAGNQPDWLAWANDNDRWTAQARLWSSIAQTLNNHPAVAWYSLISEPVEQFDDSIITYLNDNGDDTYTIQATNPSGTGFPASKADSGDDTKPGFALLTNQRSTDPLDPTSIDDTGDRVELLYYQSLTFTGNNITISNVERLEYGPPSGTPYDPLSDDEVVGSYLSLIYKQPDIENLKLIQTTEGSTTAKLDLLSNATPFKPTNTDLNINNDFGFVGDSTTVGADLSNPNTDRYSSKLVRNLNSTSKNYNFIEQNFGSANAILSSNNYSNGKPTGYGQILTNYPNGNNFKFNSISFGKEDFKLYGISQGYNDHFFTQSLKVILSRLSTKYNSVIEFENLAGFTKIDGSVNNAAYSASGGSYQRYAPVGGSGSTTITITTPVGFAVNETVAIGFMVEYGSEATATISVNGNTYTQGLTSGVDVYKSSTNNSNYFVLPVVKRLNALPAGENTISITLNVINGTACLDYWQIESSDPRPIFLNSIDNNIPDSIVPLANDGLSPVIKWNRKIAKLIQAEFFDRNIYFVDLNSSLVNLNLINDYNVNNNLNVSGHTKVAAQLQKLITFNAAIPDYGVEFIIINNKYEYTYTTGTPHNLNTGDIVNIFGVIPSTFNGTYKIKTVFSPNIFVVEGSIVDVPAIPSLEDATYSRSVLKPNTTYRIYGETISEDSRISFTTGNTISGDVNGYYTITLSNADGVASSSNPESCSIINDTQWIGSSNFNSDRHYNPYVSLTPKGRNTKTVARDWIGTMKNAIRKYDDYTPITIPSTNFFGSYSEFTNGFGPANINDLVDFFSPHQYPIAYKNTTDLAGNLSIFDGYSKPVILEEGGVPFNASVRQTTNYLLKSKRSLAGVLNSYQGYYPIRSETVDYGWLPWTSDPYYFQYVYNALSPFMNDAPIDNADSITIHSNYDGPSNQPDLNVNKPEVVGNRYMIPNNDFTSSGFTFYKSDSFSTTDEPGITVDGAYTMQTQLVKTGSALPQGSTVYVNSPNVGAFSSIFLNGFYKGSNQEIQYIKLNANASHADNSIFRNQRPTYISQIGSSWTVSPSGSNFSSAVSGTYVNLSNSITATSTTITVSDASAFTLSGVVLVDDEYIRYSSKLGNVLTVASNGRGYNNTIPANHTSGTNKVLCITDSNVVQNSSTISSISGSSLTNNFAKNNNGLTNGKIVKFTSLVGGSSLTTFTPYYVINSNIPAGTFQLSKTSGGSAVSLGTNVTSATLFVLNDSMDWNVGKDPSLPSDKALYQLNVWACLRIDKPDNQTRTATTAQTATTSQVLQFSTASAFPSNFVIGAYLNDANNRIPNGTYITGIDVANRRVTMSQSPTSNIPSGAYIMATQAPQIAQIQLWDGTKFFNYKNVNFKGDWVEETSTQPGETTKYPAIPYAKFDLVTYQNQIWQSLQSNNYNHAPANNSFWKPIGQVYDADMPGATGSSYAWIRMSFYLDNGVWKDVDTGSTFSFNQYFDPSSLRVSIVNQNPYAPYAAKNIYISEIHVDQYTAGYIEPANTSLLNATMYTGFTSGSAQTDTKITFNNSSTNGWVSSDNGIGQSNADGRFTQSALDIGSVYFSTNYTPSSITPHTSIYIGGSDKNTLNINTMYAEVKIKETLSRKGTAIVSMG